jgi:flavorubredoxin
METTVQEIADGIYRFSTHVPQIVPPAGFTFNQFLVKGDEPFLFHCGHRQMFPQLSAVLARVMPVDQLRWTSFGDVEADESGAMNQWLAAAPRAEIAFGRTGCMVSVNDLADRPPRPLADGEVVDLGGRRLCYLSTPHVPHNWESGLFYEEEAGTLLCGDLFTHLGNGPAITANDIVGPAVALGRTGRHLDRRRLRALRPRADGNRQKQQAGYVHGATPPFLHAMPIGGGLEHTIDGH